MVTTESAGGLIVHADVMIGNVEHDQLSGVVDVVQEGSNDGYFSGCAAMCSIRGSVRTRTFC